MWKWISTAVSGIVSPVTGYFEKKNENKTKVTLAQVKRITNAEDKAAELQKIFAENTGNGTWKDEYITLIISLPVPTLFLAVVYSVFTDNPELAEAVKEGIAALKTLLPNYEDLLTAVCLAAIGIRAWKRK